MAEPLNPARLDVLAKPRRRRPATVPANMRPMLVKAEERALARPGVPGLLIEPTPGDEDHPTFRSPWIDKDACALMLADCFATRSTAVIQSFIDQIAGLSRKCWDPARHVWVRDEGELNQALNFVNGLRPQNEGEAALCVKLCANYLMGVRIAGRALSGGWVDPKDSYAIAALDRAYASLWDALNRGRGKGKTTKQKIEVRHEKHIHQHVHFDGGGGENFGHQSQERAAALAESPWSAGKPPERARLPSSQPIGPDVQASGQSGEKGLRPARLQGGRTERKGER